ncbi:MAG: esterase [Candidatus Thermoplasmatota archaeon]|nr:esterase [Candidatus Thermoplasmatota archaeon]
MVKISTQKFHSQVLQNNPLKDPYDRDVLIIQPDQIKPNAPLLIGLPGFGNSLASLKNESPFSQSFVSYLTEMSQKGLLKDAVVAIPDTVTRLGGNHYLNSESVGMYEVFIIEELIPKLKSDFSSGLVGLFGKDAGGFGAYTLAVRNPGVINAFASHSGDMGFEYFFLPDFPEIMDAIKQMSGVEKWLTKFWNSKNRLNSTKLKVLRTLEASAFFSPNPSSSEGGTDLPFDWESGEFRNNIWALWQDHDPARNSVNYTRQMESLYFSYFDVGIMDEFQLVWGHRSLEKHLRESGIKFTYEEYEDGHFGLNYRLEKSLPAMVNALIT